MEDWEALRHLGHERPTTEVCNLVTECMTRVQATRVAVIGDATALVRALRLPIADEADQTASRWPCGLAPTLEILARRPRGLLVLGQGRGHVRGKPRTRGSVLRDNASWWVPIQRWSLPSRCYMDLQDVALRRMASQLLGSEPYYSAQELFAPATDKRPWQMTRCVVVLRKERIGGSVLGRSHQARWFAGYRAAGVRAAVDVAAPMHRRLGGRTQRPVRGLDQHLEAARGVAVWHGMKRQGYSRKLTL